MNNAHEQTHSPFSAGLIPVGFDDMFLGSDYDANGNRDSAGHTVGTGGTLSASPNATYTYDAAGHLTARTDTSTGKVTTFAYDHRDRLTGITRKTSGGTVDYRTTYVYDALNRRIAEQVDADGAGAGSPVTTWTVFDGQNPYADFNGAGTLTERYLHGAAVDALLARSDASGVTDWYLTDRLGSVRDIVDTSGTVLYHTGYDSFGNKVSASGSGGDRFGFTGREHDAALNLYYYRARSYDPATGRFLSKDPLGYDAGDANLYRYVGNSPTNGTDPSGMFFQGISDWIGENWIYPLVSSVIGDQRLAGASDLELIVGTGVTIVGTGGIIYAGGGAFLAEEAAAFYFEYYTGYELIVNPVDIAQKGTKWGSKQFVLGIHGNSYSSDRTAYLYRLQTSDGKFLKWGITQDMNKRYTRKEMVDKEMIEVANGTRREMARMERRLVETDGGPWNREPWSPRQDSRP